MADASTSSFHLNYHATDECLREHCPKPPEVGLEKIFATSFSCCMISRRVVEMFIQTKEEFTDWSPLIDEKFQNASHDTIFFAKANALGFDVWMDWGCEFATHHRMVELSGDTVETFAAQRVLGYVLGPEKVKELLKSDEGRDQIIEVLRDSPATYRPGQPVGASC